MIELNPSNYYTPRANADYWSVSQFKAFDKCQASALAELRGEFEREETDALLIGRYVDAYFSDEMDEFIKTDGDKLYQKNGKLYKKFDDAVKMIDRVEADPLMMSYLKGQKQVIMTAPLFDVYWKIKIDVHGGDKIVDFKTVKDFKPIYEPGYGWRSWVEFWGYDIQGAIYQRVEQIYSGRTEPLPFFLAAVTKERVPDIKLIQIPQHVLDTALALVEAKIDEFDLVKMGEVEPKRCEKCEWCKSTKLLAVPDIYQPLEA